MTTVRLHAGVVSLDGTATTDYGLTGTGALWDDGGDATFFASKIVAGTPGIYPAKAPLDVLSLPTGATVTDVTLNMRAASLALGGGRGAFRVIIQSPTDGFDQGIGPSYASVSSGQLAGEVLISTLGVIFNFAFPITSTDTALVSRTFTDLVNSLTAGGSIYAYTSGAEVPSGGIPKHRVYELSVDVTYTTTAAALANSPLPATVSPLRQYPRTDGLGASSAPRLWPPPRSVQASNRRAGGYL